MTESVHIRFASTDDITLIQEMAEVVFRKTYADIITPSQMEYMMDWMYSDDSLASQMANQRFFIAEMDGHPCGYASLERQGKDGDDVDIYHLQKIYVLPDFQGMGIGSALLRAVIDFAKEMSPWPSRLELNVNRNNIAVGFYKKCGMRILREGDFPIGNGFYMNDYIMGLDI